MHTAQLGLPGKGCAIKGLVVCNSLDVYHVTAFVRLEELWITLSQEL